MSGGQRRQTPWRSLELASPFRSLSLIPLLLAVLFTFFLSPSAAFAQAPVKVDWREGRLSVAADKASLSQVLLEVARHTDMEIRGADELQEQVSVHFSSVSLFEALKNLLAGVNYAITEDASGPGGARRAHLVIFGLRQGVAAQPTTATLVGREPERRPTAEVTPRGGLETPAVRTEQEKRAAALRAALEAKDRDALRDAVLDPDSTIQAAAYRALAKLDPQAAVSALVAAAKPDRPDPLARLQALQLLARNKSADGETVLAGLRDALGDKDKATKEFAIQALVKHGGPQAMGYLQQALRDQDPSIRQMVIQSVAHKEGGFVLLEEALTDPDESVRSSASMLLKQLGSRRAKQF